MSDTADSPRTVRYFVDSDERGWKVSLSGADYPYRSRRIALEAAIDAANTSGKRGHDAQVLVHGEGEEWVPIWIFGKDAYPPPPL